MEDGEQETGRAGVEEMVRVAGYREIMSTIMVKASVESEEVKECGRCANRSEFQQTSDDDQIGNLGPEHPFLPLTSARSWILTRSSGLCIAAA